MPPGLCRFRKAPAGGPPVFNPLPGHPLPGIVLEWKPIGAPFATPFGIMPEPCISADRMPGDNPLVSPEGRGLPSGTPPDRAPLLGTPSIAWETPPLAAHPAADPGRCGSGDELTEKPSGAPLAEMALLKGEGGGAPF